MRSFFKSSSSCSTIFFRGKLLFWQETVLFQRGEDSWLMSVKATHLRMDIIMHFLCYNLQYVGPKCKRHAIVSKDCKRRWLLLVLLHVRRTFFMLPPFSRVDTSSECRWWCSLNHSASSSTMSDLEYLSQYLEQLPLMKEVRYSLLDSGCNSGSQYLQFRLLLYFVVKVKWWAL